MGKLGPSSLGHIYREGRKQSLRRSVLGDLELRLKDGGHRCEGRVEVKHQEDWGTVNDYKWGLEEATVVCRQLGCGAAIDAPQGAHFGPAVGPIWYSVIYCRGTESAIMECSHSTVKDYRPEGLSHDQDAGAVCSGFVRLAGGEGPCSGRVEVHSGEDWTPVSDGNFTFLTAQVICAERGCGKVVSVLGHVPFRDSDSRVWAEEFRCEGKEPELWSCPRVPCPGGTCHHSGAVQVVCSENKTLLKPCLLLPMYTEVRLTKNGSSQCEGQVEMNFSGRWRALCASHWSLANANVVCRQLGCGVAVSTPRGPRFRFHCSGVEFFLWSCPVTVLGGPDCSHGNTASVICSGNQTQVLPPCNDSVSEPAGSVASDESAPYCSDSRQLRLVDGGGPCAGRVEILDQGSWGTICDDGWDLDDARVVCRQLGCGEALNATGSAHFGAGSGPIWLNDLNCTGKESHVWRCPSRGWGRHDCRHKQDAGVICSEFLALRMVSEDQQCAGWLEVFYNGTWGNSLAVGTVEVSTLLLLLEKPGLKNFVHYFARMGSIMDRNSRHPGIIDTFELHYIRSNLLNLFVSSTSPGVSSRDVGRRWPASRSEALSGFLTTGPLGKPFLFSCDENFGLLFPSPGDLPDPGVKPASPAFLGFVCMCVCVCVCVYICRCLYVCFYIFQGTLKSLLQHHSSKQLVDGSGSCSGRVEILDQGSWGTICDDGWDLDDARVVCRQLGCGGALNALKFAQLGQGSGPIWLDDLNCGGKESHVWRCPSRGWGRHDCEHAEDAGVVCSGIISGPLGTHSPWPLLHLDGKFTLIPSGFWRGMGSPRVEGGSGLPGRYLIFVDL
ncbi:hypothetical protein FD755_002574 [Muntiacus reevesi]|uniref:SRCR domain-containing protein n=1 Tax=Muntiacus reevesi TaxID=9886 RepID=A0A5J5N4P1_MUNRE|nr:hypothetical protein FD755_002574 [Muntiacus reevesi]